MLTDCDGSPLDPANLDPGVRRLVLFLAENGFHPFDSGDGVSKGAEGANEPHVFMRADRATGCDEADRLVDLLRSHGVKLSDELAYEDDAAGLTDDGGPLVSFGYSPVGGPILALVRLTDAGVVFP